MTKRETVFILKLGSQVLCVRTNLLHAYNHLLASTGISISAKFPSYNTMNRRLREPGSVLELVTEMGTFALEHHKLLQHFK